MASTILISLKFLNKTKLKIVTLDYSVNLKHPFDLKDISLVSPGKRTDDKSKAVKHKNGFQIAFTHLSTHFY